MERYNKSLKPNSRQLRNNLTDAEHKLWQKLRNKQILNTQFNRQKPILNFIVDFYSAKAKLVIELDGSQHMEPEQRLNDIKRDKALSKLGLKVLRFDNRQVLLEIESVLEVIYTTVEKRMKGRIKSPPAPLCQRGEQ